MVINIRKEIKENDVVLFIIPNEQYASKLTEIVKAVAADTEKTFYISLNKPYPALVSMMKKNSIDPNKFYFIDAITQTVKSAEPTEKCTYISSPSALTELGLEIGNATSKKKIGNTLFDSLSTLLVYETGASVIKFVHSTISRLRVIGCKAVLTCLTEDTDSALVKDLHMFADKVVVLGGGAKPAKTVKSPEKKKEAKSAKKI